MQESESIERSRRGRSARVKGHSFERQIAEKLRKLFPDCKRHLEMQYQEAKGYDLDNTGNLKIQIKAHKDYVPISKINEVHYSGNDIPVLITKGDHKEPMVVLSFKYFLSIISDVGVFF